MSALQEVCMDTGARTGALTRLCPAEPPSWSILYIVCLAIQQQQGMQRCYFETAVSAHHFYWHKCIFCYCL